MARDRRLVAQWLLTTGVLLNTAGIFLRPDRGGGLLALKVTLHATAVVLWTVAVRLLWRDRKQRRAAGEVSRGRS